MDISKLKNLVKQNGDKFVLVENGEPEIVMMSFHEYQRLAEHTINQQMHIGLANLYANTANREYADYSDDMSVDRLPETEFLTPHESELPGLPVRLEDIRLDDLPI